MSEPDNNDFTFSLHLASPAQNVLDDWSLVGPHAIYSEADAETLMAGDLIAGPGDLVPIIRADHGRALVSAARWGRHMPTGSWEYFRRCSGQSLGYPGVTPATKIILNPGTDPIAISLRDPGRMYIGCMFFQESRGAPISVVPLYLPAGPDVSEYSAWQPLILPVNALPRSGIWDFISPYGAPHLRKPLEAGALVVQRINDRTAA